MPVRLVTYNGFGAYAVRFEKSFVYTPKPLFKDTKVFLFALNKLKVPKGQKQSKKTTASARIAELTRVTTS
jgi:hypothetical protein